MDKIRHYIFDLDGVLVETRELHRRAFNRALEYFGLPPIEEYDEPEFEALPSSKKIDLYKHKFGAKDLDKASFLDVKQRISEQLLSLENYEDKELIEIFKKIKDRGAIISVVSNCTWGSMRIILESLGVWRQVDEFYHNQSGIPKPDPDLYQKALEAQVGIPDEDSIIFEDSDKGLQAAFAASKKATIVRVANPEQLKKFFR